jgi:hypothetical protein
MTSREDVFAAGARPGRPMVARLPRTWWPMPMRTANEASEPGGMLLLGGALAGDPEVLIRVEHALPVEDGGEVRDLTEPFTWLIARLLADFLNGRVMSTNLSQQEVAELTSQVHRLHVMLGTGRQQ